MLNTSIVVVVVSLLALSPLALASPIPPFSKRGGYYSDGGLGLGYEGGVGGVGFGGLRELSHSLPLPRPYRD